MLDLNDFQPYDYKYLVRRGSRNDGGYLLPSDISADFLISLGLGDDWKFELDLIRQKHVNKFIVFDHSVTFFSLIKSLISRKRKLKAFVYRVVVLLRYYRDFILFKNLHIKKRITRVGSTKNSYDINLVEVYKEYITNPQSTLILKIDIEGSEYEIIEQILELSSHIVILIIEFHEILKMKDRFKTSLEQIKSRFELIHTHANNYGKIDEFSIPDVCEFTFVNKHNYRPSKKVNRLPRMGLDSPSNPGRPEHEMIYE